MGSLLRSAEGDSSLGMIGSGFLFQTEKAADRGQVNRDPAVALLTRENENRREVNAVRERIDLLVRNTQTAFVDGRLKWSASIDDPADLFTRHHALVR